MSAQHVAGQFQITFVAQKFVGVALAGEIDMTVARELTNWLTKVIRLHPGKPVVVDLDQVSFIDSGGIGGLVGAQQEALHCGSSLQLYGARGSVLNVLQLTGVWPTLNEAPPQP